METSEFANKLTTHNLWFITSHFRGEKETGWLQAGRRALTWWGVWVGVLSLCVMWPQILPVFNCTTYTHTHTLSLSLSHSLSLPSPLNPTKSFRKMWNRPKSNFNLNNTKSTSQPPHVFFFPSYLPFAHLAFGAFTLDIIKSVLNENLGGILGGT